MRCCRHGRLTPWRQVVRCGLSWTPIDVPVPGPWVAGLSQSHGASDAAAAVFGVTEEAPSDPCAAASSLR